jgi:LysR family glycine cleavage system transcriptional activator
MLLTDEGSRLLERVRAAINEIAEGVEAIRPGDRDRILTISTAPCFAAYWLLPRLADFNEYHPDVQVNIRAALSLTNFTRDGVDMAVRFGPGTWGGLISIKLYDDELIPVCSPAFRDGRLLRVPGDVLKMPLLHDERQPWSMWFEAVGLDYRDAGQGSRYGGANLLLPAAAAGLGVALVRASLVEADLASGRLVRLFFRSVPTRYSYFIVYPPASATLEKIRVFQQWLLEQIPPVARKGAIGARAAKGVAVGTSRPVRLRRVAST